MAQHIVTCAVCVCIYIYCVCYKSTTEFNQLLSMITFPAITSDKLLYAMNEIQFNGYAADENKYHFQYSTEVYSIL